MKPEAAVIHLGKQGGFIGFRVWALIHIMILPIGIIIKMKSVRGFVKGCMNHNKPNLCRTVKMGEQSRRENCQNNIGKKQLREGSHSSKVIKFLL